MSKWLLIILSLLLTQITLADTTIKKQSKHELSDTTQRYLIALKRADIPVRSTKSFEKSLPGGFSRAGEEIIFTNPFYGWSLGECNRGMRKDIPLKTIVWKDTNNRVWVEYPEIPAQINDFGVIECGNEIDMVRRALAGFADAAAE